MVEKMTGGQAIVGTLTRQGIDTIFGLPGVQLDNTFDALYEARNKIRTIHTPVTSKRRVIWRSVMRKQADVLGRVSWGPVRAC